MKVSITVPTYNQGPYIADCLESIRSQTYQDIEVIIQDSESKDQTQAICEDFARRDGRFKYFREKDTGQSDAINRGVRRATGELWTWICSDDFYASSHAIESLVNCIAAARTSSEETVGSFGKAQFVSEKGEVLHDYAQLHKDLTRDDFQLTWPLSQPSSLLDLNSVKKIGGVKEHLHLGMDLDLFIRLLEGGKKFNYVPIMVANVRLQPDSKSVKYEKKTVENALMLVKEHFGDTGSLHKSAFARELHRLETQSWKNSFETFLSKAPVIYKPLTAARGEVHEIIKEESNRRGLGYSVFRGVWLGYHNLKAAFNYCTRFFWNIYKKNKIRNQ